MDVCFASPGAGAIPVEPMPPTAEARDAAEIWTGVTCTRERRKLQNRLNQRARRRKLRQQAQEQTSSEKADDCLELAARKAHCGGGSVEPEVSDALPVMLGQLVLVSPGEVAMAVRGRGQSKPYLVKVAGNTPSVAETCNRLGRMAQELYERHALGRPSHGHLTTVVHFNVFHGLARNAALLGLQDEWVIKGTTSRFSRHGPGSMPGTGTGTGTASYPENMRPTDLQRAVPHHPWIDLLPLPRMRDNFLRAAQARAGTVDEDAMCRDIVDVGAGHGIEHAALVVWGEPWDPRAWEATEGFLRKWGWLLDGCAEILEGTNRWRRERGLRPFRFEVGR